MFLHPARALALGAALAIASGVPAASAQPHPPKGAAEAKFQAAQKRYEKHDYAAALPLFQEAFATSASPNAELYVARCLRELGKLPEAYQAMRHTARTATDRAAEEARYVGTRDAALAELSALEARVARVVISVDGAGDAKVSVNGAPVAQDDFDEPIAVAPGNVTVTATAVGKPAFSKELRVAAGTSEHVDVKFGAESEAPAPVAASGPAPGDAPGPKTGGDVRTIGFAVAGLGVVGMAVFAITGAMAKSKFDTIETECGHVRCTNPKYADEISSGRTLTTLANISLVTGIVGLAAGGAMIALGGPRAAPAQTGLAVGLSPGGGALSYRGRF